MKQIHESGDQKIVARFEDLLSKCLAHGSKYNPPKTELGTAALSTRHEVTKDIVDKTQLAKRAAKKAINDRKDLFKPFKKFITRVINSLDATDASELTVKDARALVKKINGIRAGADPETIDTEATTQTAGTITGDTNPADANTKKRKKISVSQQSFDFTVEHFSKLIKLLESNEYYLPNEADIAVPALKTLHTKMNEINTDVITKNTHLQNMMIKRDKLLFEPKTGLVDVALDVKKYVKSIFEANSPEYKQVSKLSFRKKKI